MTTTAMTGADEAAVAVAVAVAMSTTLPILLSSFIHKACNANEVCLS